MGIAVSASAHSVEPPDEATMPLLVLLVLEMCENPQCTARGKHGAKDAISYFIARPLPGLQFNGAHNSRRHVAAAAAVFVYEVAA